MAAWAVFTGCEGDDPSLDAIFLGRGAKARAEEYVRAGRERYGSDDEREEALGLCDPQPAPVVLAGAEVLAADHYDDRVAVAALVRRLAHDHLELEDWDLGGAP